MCPSPKRRVTTLLLASWQRLDYFGFYVCCGANAMRRPPLWEVSRLTRRSCPSVVAPAQRRSSARSCRISSALSRSAASRSAAEACSRGESPTAPLLPWPEDNVNFCHLFFDAICTLLHHSPGRKLSLLYVAWDKELCGGLHQGFVPKRRACCSWAKETGCRLATMCPKQPPPQQQFKQNRF